MHLRLDSSALLGARLRALQPELPGFFAILRLQSRLSRVVQITRRTPTSIDIRTEEGMGLQLFASGGRTVFVSVDSLSESAFDDLVDQAMALLRAHPDVEGALTADFSTLDPVVATRYSQGENAVQDFTAEQHLELCMQIHEGLYTLADEHTRAMASTLTAVDDEWRIFRSDGADVHFNTWRTSFNHRVTLFENGATATATESECGQDFEIIRGAERLAYLQRRLKRKMTMALETLRGEPIPVGHYNVILDAGMAKGLAHEAFGHACESDLALDGSALTRDGRYRAGEVVAPKGVHIIDFPMAGDWADQPFSANGFVRQQVAIVEDGVLKRSLADIFSGPAIGLSSTGAERVERFDCVPLPRMSNIRLELSDAVPWDREYGLVEADELFAFLHERGMIGREETWLYLEGFRGGQVNTQSGDYVFNCTAIHRYADGRVTTHPPAIFSGQILKTLASIRGAVGGFELMRLGMCGKDGQRVPSSGGGHLFTLFGACDGVTIGGC